uniref:Variant surface glycoprotein 1125.5667 n=1 Tax=Trypanosoma brucei TaxID=5691 RepID=M4SZJ6_9TRYP|nr:variant surface glycoprotein 1869 [Trypanosoma brucei]APD75713.1 variant surface glycoprotein 1125.5667 [Trypanosoma brucei]
MTARKSTIYFLVVVVLCAIRPAKASAGDGVNMAEFSVLCQLAKLAEADVSILVVPALSVSTVDDIEMLNMSASEEQWQQNFAEKSASTPQPDSPCKPPDSRLICHEKYSKWKQVKTALTAAEKAGATKFEHVLTPGIQATAAGKRGQRGLHELAAEAAEAVSDYETTAATSIQNIKQRISHELKQALNGEQNEPSSGKAYTAKITSGSGRTSDCAGASAGESLKKTYFVYVCLTKLRAKKTVETRARPNQASTGLHQQQTQTPNQY